MPWTHSGYEKGIFYGCYFDTDSKGSWCTVEPDSPIYIRGNWGFCNYNCPRDNEKEQGRAP